MKQRILVMNGQRIVQVEQGGAWTSEKVDKAGALKPGIYNLYLAKEADRGQRHDGLIVHSDNTHIFQQIGKDFVMHDREKFDKAPEVGVLRSISYDIHGKVMLVSEAAKLSRGRSR